MSTRYLVTGAAGFIGARVTRMLLDAGYEVVGIDNVNTAYDPRLKQWRLAQLTDSPRFKFQHVELTDFEALKQLFASPKQGESATSGESDSPPFDAVLNLGARAGVQASTLDPWIYLRTNAEGTLNLLELCRQYGVEKFVLASTSSLYGADNPVPFSEDAKTDRPLSPYAASKKAAEAMSFTYHHLHQIDISVVRYFTVYGPAGRPDMSVFRFIRRIAEGESITVFGDGEQQRDFSYVDDIARGTIAAIKPLGFEIINLGSDRPVKLNKLIDQIAKLVGREPIIRRKPPHPADVLATWADVRKAEALLGWTPEVSLEE
ncbi:MAG TPA: NAD-dependent epimerase/dehydratase family protein, partial [Pirellulales bacterium]